MAFIAVAVGPVPLLPQVPQAGPSQQDYPQHFRVFTGQGEPSSLDAIVDAMAGADAVLIGEIHTDPVGHWVEAELFRRALELAGSTGGAGPTRSVALSMEMFEWDVQGVVDEYLQDLITESQFKASARPWEHYDTDYRPMVEMAKEAGVPVLAANAPRRYVNRVSRLGADALLDLSPWALSFLPPLPYPPPTPAYRTEWTELMSGMTMESQCPAPEEEEVEAGEPGKVDLPEGHPVPEPPKGPPPGMPSHDSSFMENGIMAQTLWDASMAYAVATFLDSHPGALVLHMVGGFHVMNFTGIPEKVEFYRPGTRSLVVHMDLAEDSQVFDPAEHAGRGDFVILTDKGLDLNYQRNCLEK